MLNFIAAAGVGVTGILLIVLGIWKKEKKDEKDEDTTGRD